MRNIEITKREDLINEDGTLKNPGWSRSLIQTYSRAMVKAPTHRIKEWDYYLILNDDFALCLTISDLAYFGMQSVSFLNFKTKENITKTKIGSFLTMGKLNLPASSESGDIIYSDKNSTIHLLKEDGKRKLLILITDFKDGQPLKCSIELDEPKMDSLVIATPFKENPLAFYYNQKINCMPASGTVSFAGESYEFKKENSFGTLDWGRGVWTYDNVWFWGSGNGFVNKKPFGFNIGYGFGDTTNASENIIFYDGVGHKLDDISIYYDATDYMKPWIITSSDKRFEMTFQPVLNRAADIDVLLFKSDQNQVFGKMTGTAILDDGTKLELKDLMCFVERVHNRY